MSSPVDTSVNFISSTFGGGVPGGPSTAAGSLIALLRAFLVNGWDSVTPASIVVASGVATITFSAAHSCQRDSVVTLAGITGGPTSFANLNGKQKITTKSGTTVATFACPTVGNGTCTGSINLINSPLGWAEIFAGTGTNVAVFQSQDSLANGHYLRVDDTSAQLASGSNLNYARVRGFENMSDVNTGGGGFPLDTAVNGGGYWWRTYGNGTGVAPAGYYIFGDSRFFMWYGQPLINYVAAISTGTLRGFGDPLSLLPTPDPYNTILNGDYQTSLSAGFNGQLDFNNTGLGSYSPRARTGLGTNCVAICCPEIGQGASMSGLDGATYGAFPPGDGVLRLGRRFIVESTSAGYGPRAYVPGLYSTPHSQVQAFFVNGGVIAAPATGPLAGRRLMVVNSNTASLAVNPSTTNTGASFIDITGPWR